jgi:hypothetical protein
MAVIRFPARARGFLYSKAFTEELRPTQPPIKEMQRNLSKGIKWSVREAHHSPPFGAEEKNSGAIPPLTFM